MNWRSLLSINSNSLACCQYQHHMVVIVRMEYESAVLRGRQQQARCINIKTLVSGPGVPPARHPHRDYPTTSILYVGNRPAFYAVLKITLHTAAWWVCQTVTVTDSCKDRIYTYSYRRRVRTKDLRVY